jgi:hypothetical protein
MGKNPKRPHFFEAGDVLEVSLRKYRGLSRFLEPVEALPDAAVSAPACELSEE